MDQPHVVVLFGATGDLARRKLLPGLLHLMEAGLLDTCRIVGTSLDDLDTEQFVKLTREAVDEFSRPFDEDCWEDFAGRLSYVCQSAGPQALADAVAEAEKQLTEECEPGQKLGRLHYLSVPPKAALPVVQQLHEAGLVERSRIIMEKPFGTDLESAKKLNARLHEVFDESQIFRIDHFLGKEAAQNILAFRFANGLFEPIWNRNFIDHVQIDVPETLGLEMRAQLLRVHGRVPRHGRHPPDAGAGVHGDGAADLAGAGTDQRGEAQGVPLHAAAGAPQRRTRPVPRLPRPRRRRPTTPTPRRSSR